MICLVYNQSRLYPAAVIFYTCIWVPYLQIKDALLRLVGLIFFPYQPADDGLAEDGRESTYLPAARYEDLDGDSSSRSRVEEEMCSICLVEFESEDVVSQLSKCGHVFHLVCIESWVDLNQFTCPLCRSILFNLHISHAKCI